MFNERTFDKQTFDCEIIHKSNKCSDCEKIRESVCKIHHTTISPHDEHNSIHCEKVHNGAKILNFYVKKSVKSLIILNFSSRFMSFHVDFYEIRSNPLKLRKKKVKKF